MAQMAVTKLPTKKYDILRCGVSHVLGKSTPRLECDQGLVYAVNPWLRVCGGGFLGLSPLRGRYAGWGAAGVTALVALVLDMSRTRPGLVPTVRFLANVPFS